VKAVSHLTPGWAIGIGVASLFVGAVFGTEATLLTARIWWSTYFTLVLAALGIPLEIFEIFRKPSGLHRYVVLAVNVVILVYIWRRRNEFREGWGRG
jgi:uncharacterized membrane protein (DUF2068 family)